MSAWTITYDGTTKSLADWGITDLRRTRVNLAPSTVDLVVDGRLYDAAELFAWGSTVIVKRDGAQWFYGRVEPWSRSAGPAGESQRCRLVNAHWYLTQIPFKQVWKYFAGYTTPGDPTTEPTFTTVTKNRLFLNQAWDLSTYPTGKLDSGQQITEILNYAISRGAPIAIGTISPDLDLPIDAVQNITCHEALVKMWRWSPDAMFVWDESTTPYPTLSVLRHADLSALTVDLDAGGLVEDIHIQPRQDLKRSYVHLQFDQVNDGWLTTTDDYYPDPLPTGDAVFRGFESIVDLAGWQTNTVSQVVKAEAFPSGSGWAAWWKAREPWLKNDEIDSVTFGTTTIEAYYEGEEYDPDLVNELLEGGIADWMVGLGSQRVRVTVKATITLKNSTQTVDKDLHYDCTATNAVRRTYTFTTTQAVGDPVPTGLAEEIYTSLQALAAEGRFSVVQDEPWDTISLGKKLNFTCAARTEWASLGAVVQQIADSILGGRTEVTIGAPKRLSEHDLVDLLRVARGRQVLPSYSVRQTGSASDGATKLARRTANTNSRKGQGWAKTVAASVDKDPTNAADADKGVVKIQAYDTSAGNLPSIRMSGPSTMGELKIEANRLYGLTLRLREARVCEDELTQKIVMIIASDAYATKKISGETPIGGDIE